MHSSCCAEKDWGRLGDWGELLGSCVRHNRVGVRSGQALICLEGRAIALTEKPDVGCKGVSGPTAEL